jgi:HK97 gp10 family phage protein
MAYRSRLPQIAAELAVKMDAASRAAAGYVEQQAKNRVPVDSGRLRDSIHVEREGVGEYVVMAGNTEVFYGHIVEHGGRFVPPRPFMVPAAEDSRGEISAIARAALRGL